MFLTFLFLIVVAVVIGFIINYYLGKSLNVTEETSTSVWNNIGPPTTETTGSSTSKAIGDMLDDESDI